MSDEVKLLPCEGVQRWNAIIDQRLNEDADWLLSPTPEEAAWAIAQLLSWPVRIDENRTMNDRFMRLTVGAIAARAIEATRPTDEVVERAVSEAVDNVRNARTKSRFGEMLDEEALMLLMLNELHANMPEVDRPMSMSDLSDEQAQRARNAVRKVLVASMLSAPAGRFARLTELENAMKDAASD